MKIGKKHIEIIIHVIFWILYFTSINVEWTSNWLDRSLRPRSPSAMIALIFPFYFYANAFWLIPKYCNKQDWMKYVIYGGLVFFVPELIRVLFSMQFYPEASFMKELFNRDSFLFGAISPFFIALNTSFIYRFAKNWFKSTDTSNQSLSSEIEKKPTSAYENTVLLDQQETKEMTNALSLYFDKEKPYLNPELSLRDLAEGIGTTEKKLSYLLNQKLSSNFYDHINGYRVDHFLKEVKLEENTNLSMVGIALNCGFKSKSSFYRAFKTKYDESPTQYLKKQSE